MEFETTFFDKLLNPLSIGRSADDLVRFNYGTIEQLCYLLASTILGVLTIGAPHILHEGYHHYWHSKSVTHSNPSGVNVLMQSTDPNPQMQIAITQKPSEENKDNWVLKTKTLKEGNLFPDIITFSSLIPTENRESLKDIMPNITKHLDMHIKTSVDIYALILQDLLGDNIKKEEAKSIAETLYTKLGSEILEEHDSDELKLICQALVHVQNLDLVNVCLSQAKKRAAEGKDITWFENFAKEHNFLLLDLALHIKEIEVSTGALSRSKGEATVVLTKNNYEKINEIIDSYQSNNVSPLNLCFESGDLNTAINFIEKGFIKRFSFANRVQSMVEFMKQKPLTVVAATQKSIPDSNNYILSIDTMKELAKAIQAETSALVDLTILPYSYEDLIKSGLMEALKNSKVQVLDIYQRPGSPANYAFLHKLVSLLDNNRNIQIKFSKGILIEKGSFQLAEKIQNIYKLRLDFQYLVSC